MAAEGLYSVIYCTAQGKLLAEEVNVTINRNPQAIKVETVVKALAGLSPGAAFMEVDIESAVPSAGFELDPSIFWSDNGTPQPVEFQFFAAGSILTTLGWIDNDSLSHGVNTRVTQKIKIIAQYAPWVAG
jgi:hypothetical protein